MQLCYKEWNKEEKCCKSRGKKLAGPLAEMELQLKNALEGMVNGKKVCGRRRYQMIDNIVINGLHEYRKRKTEKRKSGEC